MARGGRRLRGVLGWLPALVLVPAATFAVVHVSDLDDEFVALREVHPLDLGTTWVYQVSDHGESSGTRTSQVVGRSSLLGFGDQGVADASELTRHYTTYPGTGQPRDATSYLGVDGHTIVQFAQKDGTTFSPLDPPAPAYRLPEEGHHFSYDGALGFDPFAFDTRLEGVADLELGGHTFEDCAHWVNTIQVTVSGQDEPVDEVLEEWTCPGFGPVRSVDRIESYDVEVTEELLEFHGDAGNWWAENAEPEPVTTGTALPGGTEGLDAQRSRDVPDGALHSRLAWTDTVPSATAQPPVSDGTTMVVAQQDGRLVARDVALGVVTWRAAVPPPVVAAPVLVAGVVLVADGNRRLWALSAATGAARWVRTFDDVVSSSPTVADAVAAVATDDGLVTVLDLSDGSTVWDREVSVRPRSGPALVGDTLVVTDPGGEVSALDIDDGTPLWSRSLEAGIDAGPAAPPGDEGPVLVTDLNGTLHAYAVDDGAEQWASGVRGTSRPMAVSEDVAVVMPDGGRVTAVDMADGRRLWTRDVAQTDEPVTIVGDQAVLATRVGQVLALDLRTGHTDQSWRLELPLTGERAFVDVPPGLVGDRLVFSGNVEGLGGTTLWAYPVGDDDDPDGAVLESTVHPLDVSPTEPPSVVGGSTVLATNETLVRNDPDGSSTTLATTSQGFQPGAVVRDGTAYVRVDDTLQAIDVGDGSVLWQVPSGAVGPRRPAVGLGRRRGVRRAGRRARVGRPRDGSAPLGGPARRCRLRRPRPAAARRRRRVRRRQPGAVRRRVRRRGLAAAGHVPLRAWRGDRRPRGRTRVRGRRGLGDRGVRRRYR